MSVSTAIADSMDMPRRREGICCRSFDDESVLYDGAHHTLHFLNRTASFVWHLCDGDHSIGQIAAAVCETFVTDSGDGKRECRDIRRDVRQTLADLADTGLIESCGAVI